MLKENPRIPEGINASLENPIKEFVILLLGIGLAFVVAVAVLGIAANWLAPYIPFSWEQKVVAKAAFLDDSQEKTAVQLEAEQALTELGERLLAAAAEPPVSLAFQFNLLETDTPNAFATLGGHVFVTRGLLNSVDSENGLAMVLAHEIAHVSYRHPVQTLTRGALLNLVYAALMGSGGALDVQGVLGQAGLITALSFNRDMEFDADAFAATTMRNHYGHLTGADEFFNNMLERSDQPEWISFFETHPHSKERMQRLVSVNLLEAGNRNVTPLDARLEKYRNHNR